MKIILSIAVILLLSSCEWNNTGTTHVTDTAASVQLIPSDSPNQQMPVQPTDTAATAPMPTVDPDTSKVQPK